MKDEYQQYLKSIVDGNTTCPEVVDSFVQEAVGSLPTKKKRIMAGEENEVYDVKTVGGEMIIVRIGRGEIPKFGQEKWAIEQCLKKGIPVPQVLWIKHIPQEKKILSVCVQQRLPGDTMERGVVDYWDMPDDQVRELFRRSGELLAIIHSIPVVGFGSIDASGRGKYTSFANMILEKPGQLKTYAAMARDLGIPTSNIEVALRIIAREGNKLVVEKPVLNHGDFGGKHIMYEGRMVTGIIDWGEVSGHSPVFDLARWEYWFGSNKYFEWVKEGYSDKAIFGDKFEDLSHLIQLDLSLETIWWYYQNHYEKGIKYGVGKMNELLKKYD